MKNASPSNFISVQGIKESSEESDLSFDHLHERSNLQCHRLQRQENDRPDFFPHGYQTNVRSTMWMVQTIIWQGTWGNTDSTRHQHSLISQALYWIFKVTNDIWILLQLTTQIFVSQLPFAKITNHNPIFIKANLIRTFNFFQHL